MSAIAGILNLDGRPVDIGELRSMADAAAHLGPDGVVDWADGPLGLLFLAHHTTPEAWSERQPESGEAREIVVVGDVRLDHRDELIHELAGYGTLAGRSPGDAQLIGAAYATWGEAFPEHLRGDFAVAVWDARLGRLVLARDPCGVRPLFYHLGPERFLFASTARQILFHGSVEARLDEQAIACYLTGRPHDYLTEHSFFDGVLRVRPGHTLAVTTERGVTRRQFWDVPRFGELLSGDSADLAAGLRLRLEASVEAHARSAGPVAILTSGGMDSTLIAAIMSRLAGRGRAAPFKLVSARFGESHSADEGVYIHDLTRHLGAELVEIDARDYLPFSGSAAQSALDDEPPRFWNDTLWRATFDAVAAHGCRVALVGQGADCLFTVHGVLFGDYFRQLRLDRLIREVIAVPAAHRAYAARTILHQGLTALTPEGLWQFQHRRRRDRHVPWIDHDLLSRLADGPSYKWGLPPYGFDESYRTQQYYAVTDWLFPIQAAFHRLATPSFVEVRDPYLDFYVIKYALALSADDLYYRADAKPLLREAASGLVPDSVRLRRTKTTFDDYLAEGLSAWAARPEWPVSEWLSVKNGYLSSAPLERAVAACRVAPATTESSAIWKPVALEHWLRSISSTVIHREMRCQH